MIFGNARQRVQNHFGQRRKQMKRLLIEILILALLFQPAAFAA